MIDNQVHIVIVRSFSPSYSQSIYLPNRSIKRLQYASQLLMGTQKRGFAYFIQFENTNKNDHLSMIEMVCISGCSHLSYPIPSYSLLTSSLPLSPSVLPLALQSTVWSFSPSRREYEHQSMHVLLWGIMSRPFADGPSCFPSRSRNSSR